MLLSIAITLHQPTQRLCHATNKTQNLRHVQCIATTSSTDILNLTIFPQRYLASTPPHTLHSFTNTVEYQVTLTAIVSKRRQTIFKSRFVKSCQPTSSIHLSPPPLSSPLLFSFPSLNSFPPFLSLLLHTQFYPHTPIQSFSRRGTHHNILYQF